ncbi:hypothetical protein Lalb_Chr11g0071751 [Lupinus albus]|uniref:Uncharacterized protein n=1 Tax=Lupinus albus TaxID=3870 RepID=A0A6A4PSD6_LUPAL|nr:hypothetical protein Lalb_Chr11g0071751 [Lupinus albus]
MVVYGFHGGGGETNKNIGGSEILVVRYEEMTTNIGLSTVVVVSIVTIHKFFYCFVVMITHHETSKDECMIASKSFVSQVKVADDRKSVLVGIALSTYDEGGVVAEAYYCLSFSCFLYLKILSLV